MTMKADIKLLTLNVLRSSSGSNDSRVFFILLREKERRRALQSLEFLGSFIVYNLLLSGPGAVTADNCPEPG
jgi:hypothetical protein